MKAAVVYDSYHGNTGFVGQTIAAELRAHGYDAEVVDLHKKHRDPAPAQLLFLGSPVRMGFTTKKVKQFLVQLDKDAWRGATVVVFTTILEEPKDPTAEHTRGREKYDIGAGCQLRDLARAEGFAALEEQLWVEVRGWRGPLVDTGVDRSRRFVRKVLEERAG
jgi:flavodoxin